jgi:hypothetical protein
MDNLHTLTKQHFGQDLIKDGTDFDLDLYITLTVKVKLLYFS